MTGRAHRQERCIAVTGPGLRNAAEVILKDLCLLMSPQAARYFHWFLAIVIIVCVTELWYTRKLKADGLLV